ncbi:uncharacterized protein KIAA1211 homolog [Tetranychus urticae]|uniref:Uncharacterized protein n=1 Tax=Tetranychus urticae TaxID=32264 RepID=T1KH56_TETUR|nr:uncharacterized protein KIAA1211 homolog [Tetranychus urticae]
MDGNNDSDKKVFDNTAPVRVKVDLSKIDPSKIDDFRPQIRAQEEEMKRREQQERLAAEEEEMKLREQRERLAAEEEEMKLREQRERLAAEEEEMKLREQRERLAAGLIRILCIFQGAAVWLKIFAAERKLRRTT